MSEYPKASAEIDLAWRNRFGDGAMRIGCHGHDGYGNSDRRLAIDYIKGIAVFGKFDAETGEMEVDS